MPKNLPLVSVIMPTYNVGEYVVEAVTSIINQSYKNFELIVVDDCSNDNTYEQLCQLADSDQRIKLERNESNSKICKTLNRAFKISRGDYILRMDGDDVSAFDRLELKLDYLLNNPDVDLVGCSTETIIADGTPVGKTKMLSSVDFINKSLKLSSPIRHIWLARREVYMRLSGYREIPGVEDYDFILRAIFHGFKVTNLQDYYGYRVRIARSGSTISTIGIHQLILKKKVFIDFANSYRKTVDYTLCDISNIQRRLYSFASFSLERAIYYKSNRKFLYATLFVLFSFVSVYKFNYIFERLRLRYLTWRFQS